VNIEVQETSKILTFIPLGYPERCTEAAVANLSASSFATSILAAARLSNGEFCNAHVGSICESGRVQTLRVLHDNDWVEASDQSSKLTFG
jgi:hypothetical protein